jgi:uncharacterized membrane protein YphA (DoxX/SURF4 family)
MMRIQVAAGLWPRLKAGNAAPAAAAALRVLIGTLFFASGFLKLVNHDRFLEALETYGLFSRPVMEAAAVALPHAELIAGLLFAFGLWTRLVGAALIGQLIIFSSVGLVALAADGAVDCGCFPTAGAREPVGPAFFVRNGLLTVLCFWLTFGDGRRRGAKLQKTAEIIKEKEGE